MTIARLPIPSLTQLERVALEIRKLYIRADSQKRKQFIETLEWLCIENRKLAVPCNKLLFHYMLCELIFIQEVEYDGGCADFQAGMVYQSGSQLYSILKSELNLTEDLRLMQKIILLNDMLTDLNACSYYTIKERIYSSMKEKIIKSMKKVVTHDNQRIDDLIYKMPTFHALRKRLQQIMPNYMQLGASWWYQHANRQLWMALTQLLLSTCKVTSARSEEKATPIFYGLSLFILLEINQELCLQSALYDEFLITLNKKTLKHISIEDKINWLLALMIHIKEIQEDKNLQKEVAAFKAIYPHKLNEIYAYISKHHQALISKRKAGELPTCVTTSINCATKGCISIAASQLIKEYVTTLPSLLARSTLGPLGFLMYGAIGFVLIERGASFGVNFLKAQTINKISNKVASLTTGALTCVFSTLFHSKAQSVPVEEDLYDIWCETLLVLPNEILAEEKKKHLRYALDIQSPTPKVN